MVSTARRSKHAERHDEGADGSSIPGNRPAPSLRALLQTAVVFLAFVAGSARMNDNSLMTHVATGRLLVRGSIGELWNGWADPYLYTGNGRSWVVQSWLASVIYGLVDGIAGPSGLRLFFGISFVAIALIVWRLARTESPIVHFGICVLVLFVGNTLWSQRPLLFGVMGLGAVLLALRGDFAPHWLVPVMWLWVNTHGSFPFALAIAGLAALGRRLDRESPAHELRVLRWIGAGIAAGAVLNPIGPKLVLFPLQLLRENELLRNIAEWRSPDFSAQWARVFLLLVCVTIAAIGRRSRWPLTLPAIAMIAAALVATRNVGMAIVAFTPVAAHGLAGLGTADLDRRSDAYRLGVMLLAAATLGWCFLSAQGDGFDERGYPSKPVTWLEQRGLTAPGTRLVHQDFVGNYLSIRYKGQLRVYVDDRIEVQDRKAFADLLLLQRGRPGWKDALASADAIVWERDTPLDALVREVDDWAIRFEDDEWFVACRPADVRCAG